MSLLKALDSSNNAQNLKVNANGALECSVNEIELTATSINVAVDDLETLQTAANNTLSSIDNKVILPSALSSDNLKVSIKESISLPTTISGVSTEAKQDSIISTIGDTNNKIDAMRGSNSITDLATKLNAGLPSALDSDRLKCVLDANLADTNSKIDAIRASDTLTTVKNAVDAVDSSLTDGTAIIKIMGSESGATDGVQRQVHLDGSGNVQTTVVNTIFQVPANSANSAITNSPANSMACGLKARTTQGTASTEVFLVSNSAGSLNVSQKKTYSSETVIISGQTVSGSGTHTTSSITNDPNIKEYLLEHNFSGSDVSYEILESIDNSNFFNALGVSFNEVGAPTTANQGLLNAEIKSPFFKVKFTNSNGSSRDVNLSFVSINN